MGHSKASLPQSSLTITSRTRSWHADDHGMRELFIQLRIAFTDIRPREESEAYRVRHFMKPEDDPALVGAPPRSVSGRLLKCFHRLSATRPEFLEADHAWTVDKTLQKKEPEHFLQRDLHAWCSLRSVEKKAAVLGRNMYTQRLCYCWVRSAERRWLTGAHCRPDSLLRHPSCSPQR